MHMPRLLLCLVILLGAGPALGLDGAARAIDGGTLDVAGTTVRLAGIEAPDLEQTCVVPEGRWSCGILARDALADLVRGHPVTCTDAGTVPWAASISRCNVRGRDLGTVLVQFGWAAATGPDPGYVALEKKARAARAGIWRGDLDVPWGYVAPLR